MPHTIKMCNFSTFENLWITLHITMVGYPEDVLLKCVYIWIRCTECGLCFVTFGCLSRHSFPAVSSLWFLKLNECPVRQQVKAWANVVSDFIRHLLPLEYNHNYISRCFNDYIRWYHRVHESCAKITTICHARDLWRLARSCSVDFEAAGVHWNPLSQKVLTKGCVILNKWLVNISNDHLAQK